ncbi:MAG TPA: hypothetical protein VMX97_09640 [Hyphomicrobiaceae bacterium]|nr:hypothetical protein [Hyphomicrobiaceae bacterium]
MRTATVAFGMFVALTLTSGVSYADYCSVGGCSISCPDGCAASLVGGKCVKSCASEDGHLPDSWWIQLDNATALAKKTGKGISEILCFKGVAKTRGRSGSQCQ